MLYPVKHISISINKSQDEVYRHASNPDLFPEWLEFVQSIARQSGNTWIAQTTIGQLIFEMSPVNEFGVIDQLVTQPDGMRIKNTLRVIANGDGSEVVFTLLQPPDKTSAEFEKDAEAIQADLARLKQMLEQ